MKLERLGCRSVADELMETVPGRGHRSTEENEILCEQLVSSDGSCQEGARPERCNVERAIDIHHECRAH